MTTVNEVVENNTTNSKSSEYRVGDLELQIYNNVNNIFLQIDSMDICNVLITDSATNTLVKGNKSLQINSQIEFGQHECTSTEILPVQTFTPWSSETLPQNSNNTYGKIHGRIYTFLVDGSSLLLTEGPLYFPITGKITSNALTTIEFELADNCPIYYENNGKIENAIKSINFEVTVQDWENK